MFAVLSVPNVMFTVLSVPNVRIVSLQIKRTVTSWYIRLNPEDRIKKTGGPNFRPEN